MVNVESLGSLTMSLCFRMMDRKVHVNGTRNRKDGLAATGIAPREAVSLGMTTSHLPGG